MATPVLPLLHRLLRSLRIPVIPLAVSAVSPSLLLLILESLLRTRLPLGSSARSCATAEDETVVVKCILGVLTDDLLGIDFSILDPNHIVEGKEVEVSIVIMALSVVARRQGIALVASVDEYDSLVDGDASMPDLAAPLTPDVTASASSLTSSTRLMGIHSSALGRQHGTVLDHVMKEFGMSPATT